MRPKYDARVLGERCLAGLRRGVLAAAVVLCFAATTGHARHAAAANPVIAVDTNVLSGGVQPNGVYTPSDNEFWIQVAVMDAAPTGAFEFELSFDSRIFQYLGWSEGAFLGSTGLGTACVPNISQHTVNIGCNTVSSSGVAGPAGNGTLIIIRFHPKLAAPTCFLLTGVETATTDGVPIATSSQDGCVMPSTLVAPPIATWTAVAPPTATWTAVAAPTATFTAVPSSTPIPATAAAAPTSSPAVAGQSPTAQPAPGTAVPTAAQSHAASATATNAGASGGGTRTAPQSDGTRPAGEVAPASGGVPAAGGNGERDDGASPAAGGTTPDGERATTASTAADTSAPTGNDDGGAEHDVLGSSKHPESSSDASVAAGTGADGSGTAWWMVALGIVAGCAILGGGAAGRWWRARRR
jgi:hypothetical protein